MIYRTSQRGTYRNITDNLDLLSYRIAQISNKVASEKKINKPSDNPSGAATVLRTRTVLSEIGQYTNNVNYSNTWLTNTGNVMSSIKETIDEIYSKAEQGATDTYTGDQRKIIATEIDALFQSIIQFADSKYGDNYLLSGQQTGQQPFSTAMMIQNVVAGCENSPLWTGQVQNAGSALFEPRPDLPTQSQNFLIEVVQAGGIDSQYYAYQSALSSLKIDGSNALGDYQLTLTSKDQQYNRTEIKLVPGQANVNHTGAIGGTDQIVYSYASAGSLTVIYEYGDALTPTAASYDPAEAAVTVRLQTDGGNPPRSAPGVTARVVADAVNNLLIVPPPPGSLTAYVNGLGDGQVDLERGPGGVPVLTKITFNNKTTVAVDGKTITVYLATENQADGGRVIATAQEVMDAINAHPTASQMVDAQLSGAGATGTVAAFSSPKTLMVADPYTLARVETDLPGTHNDLVFSVLNQPQAPKGEAGNDYKVVYQLTSPPSLTQDAFAEFDPATSTVTVTLGNSAAAFTLAYDRIYNDYSSPGYHNPNEAFWLARLEASPTTAADVQKIFNDLSQRENLGLGATLAEGNSGLGKVPPGGPFQLSEGYDRPAMVRVSQDGGLTWGPPTAYNPSEFLTGGLYYNSQLGHASLTTNLPGRANDVVFTANHMGTWGDDLRVEYVKPAQPGTAASVSVGPQLWNICVTLGTNADGEIITTADDVVSLVNNHAEAGQLVTASLANYHEGGQGLVTTMDCQLLQTGEPYEIAGRTRITPLGHAVGKVGFSYNPPEQASPDLIFQALEHGPDGNKIGVRYTTSADVSLYGPNALYQDKVSISYDPPDAHGRQTVVVHLATVELPSCPDPEADRVAYDQFRDLYPVYSCTTDRAVVSTAGDVLEALVAKNLAEPENALVWASMEFKDEGWDSTAKVGPTNGTVWLSGGDESLKASDHGVALKFVPDGSALQVGDVFRADVGWYNGDSKNLDINAMSGYRTTTNVTGDALLGGNGASDNVLDVIQRLSWGLTHNDSELVAQELPKLKAALEKVTTMETNVGTRIIRNQFVLNNLELNKYAAETTLSEVEDADFTRLITDLKNSQLVYEAVLGTTGLTTKLSLLNYL
jgi:flagellin-like hook-associated protein FlgL